MARSLRLAVIQNQFIAGNLTEQQARELLRGPLVPDNPLTVYDDSNCLQLDGLPTDVPTTWRFPLDIAG